MWGYIRIDWSCLESHRAWIPFKKTFYQLGTFPIKRLMSRHQVRTISCTSCFHISRDCVTQYEDFYRYTGGRWLWGEEKELRDRYKIFNVPELQRIGARSVGAKSCSTMTKMLEGSFNRVFRLVMCNGAIAIARIPYRNIWPEFYSTASEVATMEFVCHSIMILLLNIAKSRSLIEYAGPHNIEDSCA